MPQLDKLAWSSQFVWLLVFFFMFYFLIASSFFPTIAATLKLRSKLLSRLQGKKAAGENRGDARERMLSISRSFFSLSDHFLKGYRSSLEEQSYLGSIFLVQGKVFSKVTSSFRSAFIRLSSVARPKRKKEVVFKLKGKKGKQQKKK